MPELPDEPELPELPLEPDEPLVPEVPDDPLEPDEPDEPLVPLVPEEPLLPVLLKLMTHLSSCDGSVPVTYVTYNCNQPTLTSSALKEKTQYVVSLLVLL